jgi:hypothetical protein
VGGDSVEDGAVLGGELRRGCGAGGCAHRSLGMSCTGQVTREGGDEVPWRHGRVIEWSSAVQDGWQFGAAGDAELGVDAGKVVVDGANREVEPLGDDS